MKQKPKLEIKMSMVKPIVSPEYKLLSPRAEEICQLAAQLERVREAVSVLRLPTSPIIQVAGDDAGRAVSCKLSFPALNPNLSVARDTVIEDMAAALEKYGSFVAIELREQLFRP